MNLTIMTKADRKLIAVLLALDVPFEPAPQVNGQERIQFLMTPELDADILDLIDQLVEIRLVYIDHRQRHYQLDLPLEPA